jgi:hypothetical protein
MSRVNKNIITEGLAGMLAKSIVFRKHGDRTIVTIVPKKSSKPPTEKQLAKRAKFKEAVAYAQAQLKDEASKAIYQTKATTVRTPYHIALADYMNTPVVHKINIGKWKAKKGDVIEVTATDDFEVMAVTLYFLASDHQILFTAHAFKTPVAQVWKYILPEPITGVQSIKAVATDRAENEGVSVIEV